MKIITIKRIIMGLVVLFSVAGFALASDKDNRSVDRAQSPQLPPVCSNIQTPAGNELAFSVYALGVQIYKWSGANWDFVAPLANLYADEDFHALVGIHYAGPTWETIGSKVVATRVQGCAPDSTAIPWLLLQKSSTTGFGVLRRVTYIQRVNTAGGLAPTAPGTTVGEEKRVPYTAEYYFYRADN